MPGWLQAFATYQPVSVVVDAARSLMLGGAYTSTRHVLGALAWSIGCWSSWCRSPCASYRRTA